jgi:hypothetical protein
MKDPDPKTLPLAEWGESPAKPAGPPGGSGVLSVRRELSPRQAVELSESQLAQLSLTLIAALKPQEAPAPDLPTFGELGRRVVREGWSRCACAAGRSGVSSLT